MESDILGNRTDLSEGVFLGERRSGLPTVIDGFSAWEVADEWGRSKTLIGYYLTEAEAKAVAERRGYFGGNGDVRPEKLLRLEQQIGWTTPVYYAIKGEAPVQVGVDLINQQRDFAEEAKRKALANLTPAERKSLGLDF